MKVIRNIAAAAILAAFAALSASAQQQPAANRAATPAPTQGSAGVVPDGKVAIIDTDAFTDQQTGVKRLITAFGTIDREFKPRRDEIQQLRNRYDALVKQIQDTQKVAKPESLAQLADQAETLKKDIERKQEDGQRALEKRAKELTDPVYQDIGNALQAFARQRGITLVFDVSKMGGVIMIVNNAVDITDAFIADYNQRNPAAAAATAAPSNP